MNINSMATGLQLINGQLKKAPQPIFPNPEVDQYVPIDMPFTPPDWSKVRSKKEPTMSDEEFKQAIIEQAKCDAQNGYRRMQSEDSQMLRHEFISVVSPDRKGIYEQTMARTGGKMNKTFSFWEGKAAVLRYNYRDGEWRNKATDAEAKRKREFVDLYNEAYIAEMNAMKSEQSAVSAGGGGIDISI